MAYTTLGTYRIWEKTVEEEVEKQLITEDNGVVNEHITVMQDGYEASVDVIVKQEIIPAENRSNFIAEMWLNIKAVGDYAKGFDFKCGHIGGDSNVNPSNDSWTKTALYIKNENGSGLESYDGAIPREEWEAGAKVYPNKTTSLLIDVFDTNKSTVGFGGINEDSGKQLDENGFYKVNRKIYHDFDGNFPSQFSYTGRTYDSGKTNYHNCLVDGFRFYGKFECSTSGYRWGEYDNNGILQEKETNFKYDGNVYTPLDLRIIGDGYLTLDNYLSIDRGTPPVTATSFTDEENPVFAYNPYTSQYSLVGYEYITDEITSLQATLSFDGETAVIPYRNIPIESTSYTFNLTEEEREILRVKAQGSSNVPIYYLTKTERISDVVGKEFVSGAERILTIVGCQPTLNPTVKDVNSDTIALTGNENIFVRYESMVEFSTGATASKHATIVNQSVQCGSKTIYNLYNGVIDDIESGSFIFNATDSRGLHANQVVITNTAMVEYVKPTCYQELEIAISGETGAVITVKLNGNYYNGSFGVADNTLKLEARYKRGSGDMSEWIELTGTPTFDENTYELTATFNDLEYTQGYTFQCRATDKLNTVESSQYTIKLLPVFDWGEDDFNFNVPVNIEADTLDINSETVLRHNKEANNIVLSASGGHIYLRPGGTNKTNGETIIYPDGSVKFGGVVDLSNSVSIDGNELADFVIEEGSESMGSNGTWHWRKWASGKAECYGCRNFGNMAVTTAWGNLYRSAILEQTLPNDVFARTPDSININIVHSNFGGWICKHEQEPPSAITTGSFIFVRPASATVTPSNIGFYVAGEWK